MQNKLGEFIRAHRERLQPQDVGLQGAPQAGRRRTPGLRREELAQLCAVSPTWLTWLEQGRPVSASGKMLGRLADVLQLTAAERGYLFRLADKLDPRGEPADAAPAEELAAIVDAIAAPAYILNRQWDAPAWNRAARQLFAGWLDQKASTDKQAPPNLLRFMFLDPAAQQLIVDWQERAARLVAEFRADCGKHADQPPVADLIDELARRSPAFRQLWHAQHVMAREGGRRGFRHPSKGEVQYRQVTLQLATRRDLKLVMLLPA